MKKKQYLKPSIEVVVLKQAGMLMTSGIGDPTDYPNQGDPFAGGSRMIDELDN